MLHAHLTLCLSTCQGTSIEGESSLTIKLCILYNYTDTFAKFFNATCAMLHTDMKRLYVIYVPGLGDENIAFQAKAVNLWRWFGVKPDIVQMNWSDIERWEAKRNRLLMRIDTARAQGFPVALVGASAGAAAVISAFAARQEDIVGCVIIAGKVNHPETIGDSYRQHAPRFVEAANDTPRALASLLPASRQHISSRYALIDGVVRRADSHIPGAHNKRILVFGHVFVIASQLLCGAPFFLHFLKRLAKGYR